MDHFTLSLCVGAAAGALDVIPMIAQRLAFRSCLSAFCTYLVVLTFTGKERKAVPMILLNALLLGFLISVAERYLAA